MLHKLPITRIYGTVTDGEFNYFSYRNILRVCGMAEFKKDVRIRATSKINNQTFRVQWINFKAFFNQSIESVVIEEGVSFISWQAFSNCHSLRSVTLPSSITKIAQQSFELCTSLTHIEIPASTAFLEERTFYGCSALKSVKLNKGMGMIGPRAFSGCTSLKEINIPDTVELVRTGAFEYCTQLEKVECSSIFVFNESDIFVNCTKLSGYASRFKVNDFLYDIFNFTFACLSHAPRNTTEFDIPETIKFQGKSVPVTQILLPRHNVKMAMLPKSVSFISSSFLASLNSSTKIRIDKDNKFLSLKNNMLITFGSNIIMYFNTSDKQSIFIPDEIKSIHNSAFRKANIDKVTGCKNLVRIGEYAFGESTLTSIDLHEGLEKIGFCAFNKCLELVKLTIPDSVSVINARAFASLQSLSEIHIPKSLKMCDNSICLQSNGLKKATISSAFVPKDCFSGCHNLTTIVFAQDVKKILQFAFNYCDSLKEVKLPDSITHILRSAFYMCKSLSQLNIPTGIICIIPGAFYGTCLPVSFGDITLKNTTFSQYGTFLSISKVFRNAHRYVAPSIEGFNIFSIDPYAFQMNKFLHSVVLCKSIRYIGANAFYHCTNLAEITMPSELIIVDNDAFTFCTRLQSISFPETLKEISFQFFQTCLSLDQIDFCGLNDVEGMVVLREGHSITVPIGYKSKTFANASITAGKPSCKFVPESYSQKSSFNATGIFTVVGICFVAFSLIIIVTFILSLSRGRNRNATRLENSSDNNNVPPDEEKLENPLSPIE